MATAAIYCTHKELKRVFPQLDSFDGKKQVYGWVTSANLHQLHNSGLVNVLFINGDEVTGTENTDEPNANGEWRYIGAQDVLQYYNDAYTATTIHDQLAEVGEDFATIVTQFRTDASRYLDSMLDPNMPKEALKNKEGNFDYIIIRSSALIAANFMIKSSDPNSELANALMEEANMNIENINQGRAALSWQVSRDSSQGVVRDVTYTAGEMRPVDTRGEWSGTYDLIKVKIGTGGVLGTATYNVYIKDGDGLKNQQVITNAVINGDYQSLAGGLEIRFAGSTDSSTATANNEWEIEVFGRNEVVDVSEGKSVKMTRTGRASYIRKYN